MAHYVLVSFKTCPWVQRAAIVLREKTVPFEFRHIESSARPDWFRAISPHNKVPVLRIDETITLFESGAIAEYLDETASPRLHPEDPIERAINRAWLDYLPTFASAATGAAYARDEAAFRETSDRARPAFERIEGALTSRSEAGPFFNGASFSLVDAGYAPFLQRGLVLERIKPQGLFDSFPRLKAWANALVARPTVHSFPPHEFEAMYHAALRRRGAWVARFVQDQTLDAG